ncbi:MAG: hypothetical protein ACK4N5_18575 [Myxococcales bacterium]
MPRDANGYWCPPISRAKPKHIREGMGHIERDTTTEIVVRSRLSGELNHWRPVKHDHDGYWELYRTVSPRSALPLGVLALGDEDLALLAALVLVIAVAWLVQTIVEGRRDREALKYRGPLTIGDAIERPEPKLRVIDGGRR